MEVSIELGNLTSIKYILAAAEDSYSCHVLHRPSKTMALTKRTLSLKVGAASKTRPVKEGLHGLFFRS